VVDAGVVGVPDDVLGQALVAHLVAAPGHPIPTDDDLRAWLRDRGPRHEVPRRLVWHTSPLPRTDTGKLLRRAL
jgi:acyl-coenzyme A synthetase/AMP-(fatty) acid ligase